MNRIAAAVLAAALSVAVAAPALASDHMRLDQKTEQAIREKLTAQGYEVRKVKTEDGMYEAYALKNGERVEIYLNDKLEIVREKKDD